MSYRESTPQERLGHILLEAKVPDYLCVSELSYLMLLKMAEETGTEAQLPEGCRWRDLTQRSGREQLEFYRALLDRLRFAGPPEVQAIFARASTVLNAPSTLESLVRAIDGVTWYVPVAPRPTARTGVLDVSKGERLDPFRRPRRLPLRASRPALQATRHDP